MNRFIKQAGTYNNAHITKLRIPVYFTPKIVYINKTVLQQPNGNL
ncbi:MAG TPA: hypothetical protein VL053_15695 [Arachidicoccus sp.]|nr:hypothetical protein [Arachidicoccus sp.]